MNDGWLVDRSLPPRLLDRLLAGTVGREHLKTAADLAGQTANAHKDAGLARLRVLLLAAALEEDCLHGPTAADLVGAAADLGGQSPVAPDFLALAAHIAEACRIPDNVAYYQRLLGQNDPAKLRRYLETACQDARYGLFWLHVALRQAILWRDFAWGAACLQTGLPSQLAALRLKISGDLAMLAGQPDLAVTRYKEAATAAPWPTELFRLGLAAWQAGDRAFALDHLGNLAKRHPWHVSATLAAADILQSRDTARIPLPGSLAICCYTYAKADDLDRTLSGLFASHLGSAVVTVLDNASPDATPTVLDAWVNRVGPERLHLVRLPVNIGAPAARNWLMREETTRQADFVAFLDDDVDLPEDWLPALGAAIAAYPEAGVWGCRVTDAANPAIAQGVDATLLESDDGRHEPKLSDLHAETFDYGCFCHMRPCLSVMGCCHVFRRGRLEECGDFDIRFSPSQWDDVDHDLRLALAGQPAVYQGHLAVAHRRPAPALKPLSPQQHAGAQANNHKLLAKHQDNFAALGDMVRRVLLEDLETKRSSLAAGGSLLEE